MNDFIEAAKRAAGVETGPRSEGYVNPRHVVEEPADESVATDPEPPRIGVGTRTKPIPTGDQGPRPIPSGGTEPRRLVIDHAAEIQELADRVWQRKNG